MPDFSNPLVVWRKRHHMSQSEFAGTLGIDFETVKKWETTLAIPRLSFFVLISRKIRIDVALDLLRWKIYFYQERNNLKPTEITPETRKLVDGTRRKNAR